MHLPPWVDQYRIPRGTHVLSLASPTPQTGLATASRFGFWSALGAFAASIAYGIPQILQVANILHDPWDRILIFAPSLALAPAFVFTMAAVHVTAPPGRRIHSLSGLAAAILYATLVSIVYITQLGVVIPHDLRGDGANVAILACCGQHQFMTEIDLLGYTMMSLSTFLAAAVYSAAGTQHWVRRWLMANGLLAPFLLGQMVWPALIMVGALWLITFPVSMFLLALTFHRAPVAASKYGEAPRTGKIHARFQGGAFRFS